MCERNCQASSCGKLLSKEEEKIKLTEKEILRRRLRNTVLFASICQNVQMVGGKQDLLCSHWFVEQSMIDNFRQQINIRGFDPTCCC